MSVQSPLIPMETTPKDIIMSPSCPLHHPIVPWFSTVLEIAQ